MYRLYEIVNHLVTNNRLAANRPDFVYDLSDTIVMPYGRDRIDWEVELGTVIGRTAKYVEARNAQDYVFGYMVSIDVSDRGGRPPGGYGSPITYRESVPEAG